MSRFILQFLITFIATFSLYSMLTPIALAQASDNLDNITIRVIGLDEVPTTSMQVIELPEPDLGEMNDINEEIAKNPGNINGGETAGTDGSAIDNGNTSPADPR